MNRLEKHVEKILDHMQSDQEEREEIKEELLTHLNGAKKDYEEKGLSESKAEKKAIEEFGGAGLLGNGLQETMYPYQRSLLYAVGLSTLAFGVILYIAFLTIYQESNPDWLLIQFIFGTLVTLAAMNISWLGKFHWSVNALVFLTACWNGFNYFVVVQFKTVPFLLFITFVAIVVLLSLVFIIRNSYFYSVDEDNNRKERSLKKISNILNMVIGVLVCGASVFMLWGILAMVGPGLPLLIPAAVIIAWLSLYKYQMKLTRDKPITAMVTGLVFIALVAAVPFVLSGM